MLKFKHMKFFLIYESDFFGKICLFKNIYYSSYLFITIKNIIGNEIRCNELHNSTSPWLNKSSNSTFYLEGMRKVKNF